ncbi:MAG: M20/M25/M40 family metallo-hydrolase [Candidatus Xenobiia bacterium LiM19]
MDSVHQPVIPQSLPIALHDKKQIPAGESDDGGSWQHIKDTVSESMTDFGYHGKTLGNLGAAVAGTIFIPEILASTIPAISGMAFGYPGMLASLVAVTLEEKYIGIGKHIGGLIGSAAGAGTGLAKAALEGNGNQSDGDKKVDLPKAEPKGKGPWEPLAPRLLHKAEKTIMGHVPERTKAVEISESISATVACAAGASILPTAALMCIGGPAAMVIGTIVGSLTGLVVGSLEENTIGIGRAVGEVTGNLISAAGKGAKWVKDKITGSQMMAEGKDAKSVDDRTASSNVTVEGEGNKKKSIIGKLAGYAGRAFMALNGAIGPPLMGFLMDASTVANLILKEKPVQTMDFQDRPMPEVNKERLVDNFIKIAGINAQYKSEDKVAAELSSQLDRLGISHKVDDYGNLIATVPPTKGAEDSPTIILSAHMDTVSATADNAIINDEKRIHTNERYILGGDDRAGIAQILEGVQTTLEKGLEHPEIKLVFTVGEEVGLKGAAKLKPEDVSTRPSLGYVIDSTEKEAIFLANDAVFLAPSSLRYNFSQEDPLIQVGMRSLADAGIKPQPYHGPVLAGAATDANTPAFNNAHTHSVAIGTGVSFVHTPMENVKKKDLEQIARAIVGFLTNSCDLRVDENQNIVPRYPTAGE